jgi:spore germination protein KC
MEGAQRKTTSKSVFVTTLDFVKDFFADGKQPVAGVVEIVQSESDKQESSGSQESAGGSEGGEDVSKIVYEGLAAFKDDKLVGYFNGIEARAYNFITGDIGVAIISIPFKDSYAVCEVTDASADIKTKIEEKDATIDVKISAKIRVIADGTDENVSEPSVMKEIQGIFNNQLLPQITSAIAKAQHEFSSDIFGFGSSVHQQNPDEWKKIKEEWDDIFPKAAVNVTVESNVYQTGEMRDSVLSEFTED